MKGWLDVRHLNRRVAWRQPLGPAAPAFLVVAVTALMSLSLPPYRPAEASWIAVAGLVVFGVVVGSAVVVDPGGRLGVVPPLLFLGVVAAARAVAGGSGAGVTPLVLLPLMWIVVYGRRWQLWWVAAGVAALFMLPWWLVGPPRYDPRDWRAALLWMLIAGVVCPALQRGVALLRASVAAQKRLAGQVSSVLRAATDNAIIATDLGGRITVFSPGAERMLGYRAADMVCGSPLTLHDPADLRRVAAQLGVPVGLSVLTTDVVDGTAVSRRYIYRTAGGVGVPVRLAVTRLLDEDEVHGGWVLSALDLSAEDVARTEAVDAQRRWRVMMDHLPDVTVLIVDENLRFQITAGAGLRRVGAATFQGKTVRETSSPDNADVLEPLYRAALAGQQGAVEVTSSRTGAALRVTAVPLPTEDNSARALVMVIDVTEARRREAQIAVGLDYARQLFTESPHGSLLINPAGDVDRVNPSLCAMLGVSAPQLLGQPLPGGPLTGLITKQVLTDLSGGVQTRYSAPAALETPDGETVFVEVAAVGLTPPEGLFEPTAVSARAVLVSVVDVSERRRFEQQLAHLADHDPLTGLANRRRFDAELAAHLDRCERYGSDGALMLIDLDNFKQVNDTLGHSIGDELILSVAAVLRRRLRTSDVLARLGGDEFAVLLPVCSRADAETVAADLIGTIRDEVTVLAGGRRRITASLGVVMIRPPVATAGELVSTADLSMYDAKDAGRNTYVMHDPTEHAMPRSGARLIWAARIEHALEQHQFAVHAQPVMDVVSGDVTGAELLIRMLGDRGELIMPGEFLEVAERSHLITAIDAYMLRQAATVLADLKLRHPHVQISVNLSGRSVADPLIAALIPRLCSELNIDPTNLILEITETAAVQDIHAARAFAEDMARLGCRFALDDFGAGFGSFYYLKHLIFDFVKIDGEFVSGVAENTTDQLIISSIVDIAHGLDKQVVAEFVKDETTLKSITALGVDKVQGYHIGRPVPVAEFTAALDTRAVSRDGQPDLQC